MFDLPFSHSVCFVICLCLTIFPFCLLCYMFMSHHFSILLVLLYVYISPVFILLVLLYIFMSDHLSILLTFLYMYVYVSHHFLVLFAMIKIYVPTFTFLYIYVSVLSTLILLHSERPKWHTILDFLSAIGLIKI